MFFVTPCYMFFCFFFFNDTATTEIYTLSLHDALPICAGLPSSGQGDRELGELAGLAVYHYRPPMLLSDDVVADRQPEPGAFASRFSREERLEQLVAVLGRDADTVVTHPDLDSI